MKKQIILLLALSSFLYAKAQNYDTSEQQSVKITTTGISTEDLFSYAKEWLIVSSFNRGIADNTMKKKFNTPPFRKISYLAEDANTKKVYGLLEYAQTVYGIVTFKLILSCKENKVILTMCCGRSDAFETDNGIPTYFMEQSEMDSNKWEQVKADFTDFFGKTIYENIKEK